MPIKRLEEILDVRTFDRSKQPVTMTDEGAGIVSHAKITLDHFDRIGALAGPHGTRPGDLTGTVHRALPVRELFDQAARGARFGCSDG